MNGSFKRSCNCFLIAEIWCYFDKAPNRLAIFRQCSHSSSVVRLAASQSSKSWPGGRCVHRWYSLLIWLGWGDRDAWTICHLSTASPLLINWANIRWRHQTFTQKCTHTRTAILGYGRWWSDRLTYSIWVHFRRVFSCVFPAKPALSVHSTNRLLVIIHWNWDRCLSSNNQLIHNGVKIRTLDDCNKQLLQGWMFQTQTRP